MLSVAVGNIGHPSNMGEWEAWHELKLTLEPFLRNQVGNVFLKWMLANAKCVQNKLKSCSVRIPGLGHWKSAVGGPQRYQLKSLTALQDKFAEHATQSDKLVEVMKRTQCLEVLLLKGSKPRAPLAKL